MTIEELTADLKQAIAAYRQAETNHGTMPHLAVMGRLHALGAVVTDKAQILTTMLDAERGWTTVSDPLPDGTPRTMVKQHDPHRQARMLRLNLGRRH